MKLSLLALIIVAGFFLTTRLLGADFMSPADAAKRVEAGTAILVDVREPGEWASTGVAEPAVLLSLSDLRSDRVSWKPFLDQNKDKELILYCRSGNRSAIVGSILTKEGYRVANAGGFQHWADAQLPTRKVSSPAN